MTGHKIYAIVGLPGAGKSIASDYLVSKGMSYLRFGQITLDEVKKRGLTPGEASERPIREELRQKHGMGAFAILNIPKIDQLLKEGNVVADGLYSFEEYVELKNKYAESLIVIAIYASPKIRYERLSSRVWDKINDPKMRNRSYTKEEAMSRDYAQIDKLHQGGPIAMADFTIINEKDTVYLHKKIDEVILRCKNN